MSELIEPEEVEEALRDLLNEIPAEPVSLEWIDEALRSVRTRLEESMLEAAGGGAGTGEPIEVPGYVPRDTSELALAAEEEESEEHARRRRAIQIALDEQEAKSGGSKLLGQIIATKIDHAKVSVQPLDLPPEFKRLAPRAEEEVPEEEPPPEIPEPGPELQLADERGVVGGVEEEEEEAAGPEALKAETGGALEAPAVPEKILSLEESALAAEPAADGPVEEGSGPGIERAEAAEEDLDTMSWQPDQGPAGAPELELAVRDVGEGVAIPPEHEADGGPGVGAGAREGIGASPEDGESAQDGPQFSLDLSDTGMESSGLEEGAPGLASGVLSVGEGGGGGEAGGESAEVRGEALSEGASAGGLESTGGAELGVGADWTREALEEEAGPEIADVSLVALGDNDPLPVADLPLIHPHRYQTQVRIGAGSQGIVAEVRDRYLARQVALKVLRKELAGNARAVHRFWREAQITGQLAHSGIVPIFDIGVLSDRSPYYTMRRVRGMTLRTILRKLRRIAAGEEEEATGMDPGEEPEVFAWAETDGTVGDKEAEIPEGSRDSAGSTEAGSTGEGAAEGLATSTPEPVPFEKVYSRRRLLEILISAAHTLGYAHARGVIHRDVKPGNIIIGSYGEVLVLDWGIARVLGKAGPDVDEGPVVLDMDDPERSMQGVVKGTPAYMSPEQARGDVAAQGPWTDVYALGLILYEILAGEPARKGVGGESAMAMARDGVAPSLKELSAGNVEDPIPSELIEICARCLEAEPSKRFPDAEAFATALEAYTTGEQRREIAERRALEAEHKVAMLAEIDDEIALLEEEVELLRKSVQPWMDISSKRKVWAKEDRLRATRQKRDDTLAQAHELYTQALGDDPDNRRARRGLCKLYYEQLLEAERWGRTRESRRLEAELKRLDDGLLATALRGFGAIELTSEPDAAGVWSFDLRPRDRQLKPAEGRYLGTTPLSTHMPMGSYLVELRWSQGDDQLVVKYPVRIRRQEKWSGHVRVPRRIPEGFVFVPGSTFVFGGDREAPGSGPRQEVWVDDFLIAIFPVTCAEYLEFLQDMLRKNPNEAAKRVPRNPGPKGGEPLWPRDPSSGYRIPGVDPHGGRWSPQLPVRCVSREDAVMYCLWLSSKTRLPVRLPTEMEWEKAGRGVDGRSFPWGNEFDPSFCNMKDSQPGAPELAPVGSFPVDCSPYGVRDMSGGVIEWCAGPFNRDGVLGIQKGGFWLASEPNCRLARRFGVFPTEPEKFCGFRVAISLED